MVDKVATTGYFFRELVKISDLISLSTFGRQMDAHTMIFVNQFKTQIVTTSIKKNNQQPFPQGKNNCSAQRNKQLSGGILLSPSKGFLLTTDRVRETTLGMGDCSNTKKLPFIRDHKVKLKRQKLSANLDDAAQGMRSSQDQKNPIDCTQATELEHTDPQFFSMSDEHLQQLFTEGEPFLEMLDCSKTITANSFEAEKAHEAKNDVKKENAKTEPTSLSPLTTKLSHSLQVSYLPELPPKKTLDTQTSQASRLASNFLQADAMSSQPFFAVIQNASDHKKMR